jgi:hypothetical protein
MSFNSTDITNGVSISGSTNPFNTYVKVINAGVYNIQFSAQVDKTDGGTDDVVIWLRKNGIDLTDTATTLTLPTNNSKVVAAWNWFVTSAAGDYYQIIWVSADTDLRLLAEPISGTHPGIPSVILTANRVDQFLSNTGSFSGSFNGSFTGSLFGTASWATNALTASFVNTASTNAFVQNGNSFGAQALLGTNDNQSLAFETSGSVRMFISSSGNVGIGTLTPVSTLDVSGSVRFGTGFTWNNTNATLNITSSVTSVSPFVRLVSNATTDLGGVSIEAPSVIGAWPLLRVSAGGITAFQIDGNRTTTIQAAASTTTATSLSVPFGRVTFESDVASGTVPLLSLKNNGAFGTVLKVDTSSSFATGWFLLDVARNGTTQFSVLAGSNTIVNTGNLLIGNTTGTARLTVRGSGATSATTTFRTENTNASASLEVYDNNSKIEIYRGNNGTTGYDGTFIYGPFTTQFGANTSNKGIITFLQQELNSSVYSGIQASNNNYGNVRAGVYFVGANSIRFVAGSTVSPNDRNMFFSSNGNFTVGGLTDAGFRLDVSGSARITDGLTVTGSQFIFTSGSSVELRATGTGVTIGNIVTDIHTVTGSLSVSGSITSSLFGTASYATQALSASWAPGGGSTFPYTGTAQITGSLLVSGSSIISNQLTIGSSSQGPNENTLTLGARDAVNEGGQLGLNAPGGTYTSASFLDLYQDRFRILRGTNAGSTGEVATWNLQTLQMQLPAYNSATVFTGSAVAGLGVDSSGNIVTSTRTGRYGTAISGSTIGTGVTAQTIVYSQLIPANALVAGDIIRTYFRFRKLSTNANATYNILVNTSNAVAGATTLATLTANTVHNHMKRDFYIAQGNATTSVGSAINTATDDITNTQLLSVINWAVDQWIIYTVTLGTTDSGYGLGYSIEQVL